ncbi:hypothetical protein BFW01_g12722 [Lasiodiplodia theobromae]|nr:hypothetical protein BFW01_g12722 [Lasiodiplodia theobromae]
MNHAQSYIHDYAWSSELLQATEDLYIAILDAIEAIVEWIAKCQSHIREVWEAGKAFFQQSEYGKELEHKITANIKIKVEAFDRIVERCLHREVHGIAQNVYQVGQALDIMNGKMDENTGHFKKVHAALYTVEDVLRGIEKDFDAHRTELAERQRLFEERQKEIQAINEQHFNQLQQYEYALACSAAAIHGQLQQQQQPRQIIRISQLLATLNLTELDPNLDTTDQVVEIIARERDVVLFFGRNLDSRLQSKISTVMQNLKFVSWFKGLNSRALIISDMDMNALQGDGISPLSYMCAALARTVAEIQYAHPIAFFCRFHSDPGDRLHGASGMMRSLIAQLALFCVETTPDLLSFLTPPDLDTIKTGTLSDLCRLFDNLVKAVGSGVIICMIDGVNFFESEMCLKEMHDAMRFLNSLLEAVDAAQSGLVLKLLVTSSTASENCRYWFPNRVDLPMPREFLLDGQGLNGLMMPMF